MAGGKRRKYEVDDAFYEKLLETAYLDIEDQTKAVLELLGRYVSDEGKRALFWSDLQGYIEKREKYRVCRELSDIASRELKNGFTLCKLAESRWKFVLKELGGEGAGEHLGIDWHEKENVMEGVRQEAGAVIDSAVEMVAVEGGGIMDRMLALGDDREKGLVLYQAVENLMYLREKYRVNTELLDFIRIEQEMGNSLIDMVMMKRLRMVMDYGFQEGGGDGSGG